MIRKQWQKTADTLQEKYGNRVRIAWDAELLHDRFALIVDRYFDWEGFLSNQELDQRWQSLTMNWANMRDYVRKFTKQAPPKFFPIPAGVDKKNSL